MINSRYNMKKLILLLSIMISLVAQAQIDSKKTALLIIDIQNFYFAGGVLELTDPIPASLNAQKLLFSFRQSEQLIVHIKHGSGARSEIHENVVPLAAEKIIVKNEVNSFLKTDLLDYLNKNEITNLIICGMQTHMCVEAATRAAADYGFECTVIHDACATRSLSFNRKTVKAKDVHTSTLATLKSYSKIMSTNEFLNKKDKNSK